ncbi:MAG: AI-2E family transporter [Thermoanaerobaculia bacterium]|nr:AI-2E family transporter [Thermoanaerobaculia bacterium]
MPPSTSQDRFQARVVGLAITVLLVYALFLIFRPFAGPIVWAALLAFLLFSWNKKLRRKVGGRPALAAMLMTLGVTLGIVIPMALIGVAFASQASDLVKRMGLLAERYRIAGPQDLLLLPPLRKAAQWMADRLPVTVDEIQRWIVQAAQTGLQYAVVNSRFVFLGALGAFVGLSLMLFILFFFFRDGESMTRRGLALVPMSEERKRSLVLHLSQVTRAVVYGSLLTALAQGALVGIAFAITKLPSPVVFGVLAAVASLIPMIGTSLVLAPAAIVLAAQGRWGAVIFMAIWGVAVVGLADNFLRPMFISGRAEIATLPIFIGVLGGLTAFGPIGLFLGPLVIALALALLRFIESDGRAEPAPKASRRGA